MLLSSQTLALPSSCSTTAAFSCALTSPDSALTLRIAARNARDFFFHSGMFSPPRSSTLLPFLDDLRSLSRSRKGRGGRECGAADRKRQEARARQGAEVVEE